MPEATHIQMASKHMERLSNYPLGKCELKPHGISLDSQYDS